MEPHPDPAGGELPVDAPPPDPAAPPERLLLVIRRREDGSFLLVRREAGAPLTMLSTTPPARGEGLVAGIASLVRTHLAVSLQGAPTPAEEQRPARMEQPYRGGPGLGLLRAVAVEVTGEPVTDALYDSCEALSSAEAEAALSTDLERLVFRDGVALFG